jgi:hypothetical protein
MSRTGTNSSPSLSALQTEFGGSAFNISLSNYYRRTWNSTTGVIVPPYAVMGTSTPTSGQISLSSYANAYQGVQITDCGFMGYQERYDPFYRLEYGSNFPSYIARDLEINNGRGTANPSGSMRFRSGGGYQESYGGGGTDIITVWGDQSAAKGSFKNHANGRTLRIGKAIDGVSAGNAPYTNVTFDGLNTVYVWNLGLASGTIGSAGSVYPNDLLTTTSFFGAPLGFLTSGSWSPSYNATMYTGLTYFITFEFESY